jgi:hypothetical protein
MEILKTEKPDKEVILESFCSTDEQIKNIVSIIRNDIIPKIKNNISVVGEKIVVRYIMTKEAEETKSGLVSVPGQKSNLTVTKFFNTHPFQAVIISVGKSIENGLLNVGDHVLLRKGFNGELTNDAVIIDGNIYAHVYFNDIICSLKD